MNILSKLFGRTPLSPEQRLASCLDTLTHHVNAHWSGILSRFRSQLPAVFTTASHDERYRFLRELESLYSGMGSLNDDSLSPAGEQARGALYATIQDALRDSWRALGREHHTTSSRLHPIGSIVRLIPGSTRYLNRDGSACIVSDTASETRHTWRVVQHDAPDVTNMPQCTITDDSTFMLARHDSLALSQSNGNA